jgi:hypothetical protein
MRASCRCSERPSTKRRHSRSLFDAQTMIDGNLALGVVGGQSLRNSRNFRFLNMLLGFLLNLT